MAATQQATPATDNGGGGASKGENMDFQAAAAAAAAAANPALAMMQAAACMNPMMLSQMNGSAPAATTQPYYFGNPFPAGYPGAGFLPTNFPFANPLQMLAANAQNAAAPNVATSISAAETTKSASIKEERVNTAAAAAVAAANNGGNPGHVISHPRAITPSVDGESLTTLPIFKDNSSAIMANIGANVDGLKRDGGAIGSNRLKHSRSETNFLSGMGADLSGSSGGTVGGSAIATGNTLGALSQSSSVPNFSAMQGLNSPIAVAAAAAVAAQAEMDDRELKRQRRKQSNRESARRSRLRKQAECEELGTRVSRIASENDRLLKEARQMRIDYASLEAEIKVLRSTATEATLAEAKEAAKTARQKSEAELEQAQGENVLVADKLSNLESIHEKPDWKLRLEQDRYRAEQSENDIRDEVSSQGEK